MGYYSLVDLAHLLVYSHLVLLHEEQEEGDLHCSLGEILIGPPPSVVFVLPFGEAGDEGLAFADEVGLLEGDFDHFGKKLPLEYSQVVPFLALDEDEGVGVYL